MGMDVNAFRDAIGVSEAEFDIDVERALDALARNESNFQGIQHIVRHLGGVVTSRESSYYEIRREDSSDESFHMAFVAPLDRFVRGGQRQRSKFAPFARVIICQDNFEAGESRRYTSDSFVLDPVNLQAGIRWQRSELTTNAVNGGLRWNIHGDMSPFLRPQVDVIGGKAYPPKINIRMGKRYEEQLLRQTSPQKGQSAIAADRLAEVWPIVHLKHKLRHGLIVHGWSPL